MRWGVVGATSRIHRQRLRPAFGLAGERIVAEASRRGDDLAPYREVLTDPDVDAVYIPLPNFLHADVIQQALESGKHVLCEKPLTMSGEETDRLYAVAQGCGRWLSEAYMWPHHPRARRLCELVAAGEIGRLIEHQATFTFPLDRADDHRLDARGGGVLFDTGIYCLGPALVLSGRGVGAVAATAVRNEAGVDTSMSGWLEVEPGTSASFTVSFEAPLRRVQVVIATAGTVVLDPHFPGPERAGDITILRPDGSRDEVPYVGANSYERMIADFVVEAEGDADPAWTPTDSIRLAHLEDHLHALTTP
ncbi:MAG: Gfo/Idh/MocA family protein [Ilumatobacteraceae bacterium]